MEFFLDAINFTRQQWFLLAVLVVVCAFFVVIVKLKEVRLSNGKGGNGGNGANNSGKAVAEITARVAAMEERVKQFLNEHDGRNHDQAAEMKAEVKALRARLNETHEATLTRLKELAETIDTLAKK